MSESPLAEQIDAVTRLLDDLRWARNEPGCIEYRTFEALKTIAKDLRARQPQVPGATLLALRRRLADAAASKTAFGFEHSALMGIGQETIGRWPVIRQALERFGAEAESR